MKATVMVRLKIAGRRVATIPLLIETDQEAKSMNIHSTKWNNSVTLADNDQFTINWELGEENQRLSDILGWQE